MPSSFTSLKTHIAFSTKNRVPMIDSELQPRLFQYIGGICRKKKCTLLAAGGVEDHVHLLVALHPTIAIASLVGIIKSNSTGWVHDTFPKRSRFRWQRCYGAFTVSESATDSVKRYLATQDEHHRKMTFKEEFIHLLDKHKIEYDPEWMWE
ncbi:hypothetical protein PHYC_01834 [Phycisphaerales bacterium]|nr:hypothetical protein PHYC_01834 [Phycisphaerales bacterium]